MVVGCECRSYCSFYGESCRMSVCDSCRKTVHQAGSTLFYEDTLRSPMVLLSGIVGALNIAGTVFGYGDTNVMHFILTRGAFFNADVLWSDEIRPGYEFSGMECFTDCVVARIDMHVARRAFSRNPDMARAIIQSLTNSWLTANLLASAMRKHGVYEGIRDLLLFLSDKGVILTHQQLAVISNHSRPSVTKAIGELRKNEPDVWQRVSHVLNCS